MASFEKLSKCRSGLVGWSRLRAGGSKPDSTEDPPCMCVWCVLNLSRGPDIIPLVSCGSLERGCQLKSRPRNLTAVQNYEVRSKITPRVASKRDVNIAKLKLEILL
ncbi:hypothetical protein AVEN_172474-1 [Araneus ventricosus]|uniref:Uncharacterized protein n=1 Tax=Araneus ventricosus TaxID=182803 RepID=A0A4Y2DXK7_ARAVE|nr:hypothetical protein AVEN_172474-1 [Araneus ventricosus]